MLMVCMKNFYCAFPVLPNGLFLFSRLESVAPFYMILFPFVDFHFEFNNSSTVQSELIVLIYMILFLVRRFSFLVQQQFHGSV